MIPPLSSLEPSASYSPELQLPHLLNGHHTVCCTKFLWGSSGPHKMRMSAKPPAPDLACVHSTSCLVVVASEVCGYLILWYVWWWSWFHQLSVVLWPLETGRGGVCMCVGSGYLPNWLTWSILLISSFQPLPISISLPIREEPKMFLLNLSLGVITWLRSP